MAQYCLNHFRGRAQGVEVACEPPPERVPSVPFVTQRWRDIAARKVVEMECETLLEAGENIRGFIPWKALSMVSKHRLQQRNDRDCPDVAGLCFTDMRPPDRTLYV